MIGCLLPLVLELHVAVQNFAHFPDRLLALLIIANSVGELGETESTGLGAQLIRAFSIQLGGAIETDETSDAYTLSVNFDVQEFEPEARDF